MASKRFLAIPSKVFANRSTVIQRKENEPHPVGEGASLATQHLFTRSSPGPRGAFPSVAGPHMSSKGIHPGSTHSDKVGNIGAICLCFLGQTQPFSSAQSSIQTLT